MECLEVVAGTAFGEHCQLLAPYFHTGIVEALHDVSLCAATTPLTGAFADDNRSFNMLCASASPVRACVHSCAVQNGRISGRIVVPGALLLVLHERGIARGLSPELLGHLHRHGATQVAWARALFADPATIQHCAEQQYRWLRDGPEPDTRLLMKYSALGRFASYYLASSGQALDLDEHGQWMLLIRGAEARLRGFWCDEYRRVLATMRAASTLDPRTTEVLQLVLGTASFEREFSAAACLPAPSSAPSMRCSACDDNQANIVCMPCGHACLCAACAQRAFGYAAERCYGTGHPVPAPGSRCPLCSRDVNILLRIHQT